MPAIPPGRFPSARARLRRAHPRACASCLTLRRVYERKQVACDSTGLADGAPDRRLRSLRLTRFRVDQPSGRGTAQAWAHRTLTDGTRVTGVTTEDNRLTDGCNDRLRVRSAQGAAAFMSVRCPRIGWSRKRAPGPPERGTRHTDHPRQVLSGVVCLLGVDQAAFVAHLNPGSGLRQLRVNREPQPAQEPRGTWGAAMAVRPQPAWRPPGRVARPS